MLYEKEWQEIAALERDGKTKTALETVQKLFERIEAEGKTDAAHSAQRIKTLIYLGKYQNMLEEEGFALSINRLRAQADKTKDEAAKALLRSMLAELYENYLNANLWKLRDRTAVGEGASGEDLQTWDLNRFTQEIYNLHFQALEPAKLSQSMDLGDFGAVLQSHEPRFYPTLYDLLAQRALNYFQSDKHYLSQPAYKFYVDQPQALGDVDAFIAHKFESKDSSSTHYQAILIYQKLLAFHRNDAKAEALVFWDLKRLNYLHGKSVLPDKDAQRLAQFDALAAKHRDLEAWAEIMYYKAEHHKSLGAKHQAGPTEPYRFEYKKALELAQQGMNAYPNSYGGKLCEQLANQLRNKDLRVSTEAVWAKQEAIMASFSYRNIKAVHWKIIALDETWTESRNWTQERLVKYLNEQKILRSGKHNLPDDQGDMQPHRVEFHSEGLDYGTYAVVVSDQEDFRGEGSGLQWTYFAVSDLAFWSRQEADNATGYYVTNRLNGQPQKGVTISFYEERYNSVTRRYEERKAGSTQTDGEGYARMPQEVLRRDNDYGYRSMRIELTQGKDNFRPNANYSYYGPPQANSERNSVTFFTDRAIYRPGQLVYFKGVMLRHPSGLVTQSPKIAPNAEVEVRFLDANYQEVHKLSLKTNEFGTFQGSFTAPVGGLTGQMQLKESRTGSSHYVQVEEYKRPKFETKFEPVKGSFQLEQEVVITGVAKAYSGQAIDGAQVKYRVMRQASFPYWPWWRWGYYIPYSQESQEIAFGDLETDAEGRFTIRFKALADRSIPADQKPQFTYTVTADVTDGTGETRGDEVRVNVGYIGLNLSLDAPDRLKKGSKKPLKINSTNLNGEFQAAKGKLRIEQLEVPKTVFRNRVFALADLQLMAEGDFRKVFPSYALGKEEERQNWKVLKTVQTSDFDTKASKEVALNEGTWPQGVYRIILESKDDFGNAIELQQYFTLYEEGAKAVPAKEALFLEQSFFGGTEPGQTLNFNFGSAFDKANILFEIEHQGQIVERRWYNQSQGRESYSFKVEEKHRGNVYFRIFLIADGRAYQQIGTVQVPWSNKDLKIEFATFRDKLQPGQNEEWQLKVSGPKGEKVLAELLASMYDASLDAFVEHNWGFNPHPSYYLRSPMSTANCFSAASENYIIARNWNPGYVSIPSLRYSAINWFGYPMYDYAERQLMFKEMQRSRRAEMPAMAMDGAPPPPAPSAPADMSKAINDAEEMDLPSPEPSPQMGGKGEDKTKGGDNPDGVKVRTNLNETVFFFPELRTDAEGNVLIKFKMNEALTRWKFQAWALTPELQAAVVSREIVTQKDLMVQPNAPRFFRQNDEIGYVAKISNISEQALSGQAKLQLFNALNMQPVDAAWANASPSQSFSVEAGRSTTLTWKLKVPADWTAPLTHRVIAQAGSFSDGEESAAPVLSNRMLVTESMPLPIRGGQSKTFDFKRMAEVSKSPTAKSHQFTLEFTQNPAWYALQALPYLMEYPYECTEQVFSRFYANSLASSVANSHPRIKSVFDRWKNYEPKALESNLSKNQELKYALLEETPWVLAAQNEAQQKKNVGLLFDLNRMSDELGRARDKMAERQLGNGGFAWFPGGRDDWYISQYIAEGMGHLQVMGVEAAKDEKIVRMMSKTVSYMDNRLAEYYTELKRLYKDKPAELEKDHLGYMAIHYLYTRSFYLEQKVTNKTTQEAIAYYEGQAAKYWNNNKGIYMQGMLALALHRKGNDKKTVDKIVTALRENSLNSEEMGMYWKYASGYYWYQLPIETHALMIEVFDEIAQDAKAVDDLKTWLLKAKQTTHWKTTKATAAACYALLRRGDNWLLEDKTIQIELGGKPLEIRPEEQEAGTGYFKKRWDEAAVKPEMAQIKVTNPNKVVAWGAAYWQYFEDLDKITHFEETPLKINKSLFRENMTDRGPVLEPINEKTELKPGDLIKVRIELRVDRDMEYVHMKDARASGFEPVNVLSSYKYQGGLGYYESTRDAATNFFFSYLSKGVYVFEYPLRVQHRGNFSNGITTIQCMYAPEFTSHSQGIRVKVN